MKNKKIVLISCSNGISNNEDFKKLIYILESMNLDIIFSKALFKIDNTTISAKDRAEELTKYLESKEVDYIFDVSGGDLSNEVLNYLDFDKIKDSNKYYFGYSDLTTLLNSLNKNTKVKTINYQIRNIIKNNSRALEFENYIKNNNNDLFNFNYEFIRGNFVEGIVVGGNIRCLLKLAGTRFLPEFDNKILFLEAMGGDFNKISTFAAQLYQIGAFNNLKGLLIGTFLEYEEKSDIAVEKIFMNYLPKDTPIVKTKELGHLSNSKAIEIGNYIKLNM